MFFSSWDSLLRILVMSIFSYVGLVFILRISGNRTLSKMNSFDFVVTVALGSALATGILQKSIPLVEVLFLFTLLVGFQFAVTWLPVRSKLVSRIAKSEPKLVLRRGEYLYNAMRKARVTEEEIISATRQQGFTRLEDVEQVVLETNGELSATGLVLRDTRT